MTARNRNIKVAKAKQLAKADVMLTELYACAVGLGELDAYQVNAYSTVLDLIMPKLPPADYVPEVLEQKPVAVSFLDLAIEADRLEYERLITPPAVKVKPKARRKDSATFAVGKLAPLASRKLTHAELRMAQADSVERLLAWSSRPENVNGRLSSARRDAADLFLSRFAQKLRASNAALPTDRLPVSRIVRYIVDAVPGVPFVQAPYNAPGAVGERVLMLMTPRVFLPLLADGKRWLGAYGGRGSGKSHFFAEWMVERALTVPRHRGLCVREHQASIRYSSYQLIADKLEKMDLGEQDGFSMTDAEIRSPGGGVIIFMGLREWSAEKIKSIEAFHTCYCEEAVDLSANSLMLLEPSVRGPGSKIAYAWNPRSKLDQVDKDMRQGELHPQAVAVAVNFENNPLWSNDMELQRQKTMLQAPYLYDHIYGGGYAVYKEGAYLAEQLARAMTEDRISKVNRVDHREILAFADLGASGPTADDFVFWFAQRIGKQIIVFDYYQMRGQIVPYHAARLRERGYTPGCGIRLVLPHDGTREDATIDRSYKTAFEAEGYKVEIVKNQGKGAALERVKALQEIFPYLSFDKENCDVGLLHLGAYHPSIDKFGQHMGPEHDASSHAADAAGLMAVWFLNDIADDATNTDWSKPLDYTRLNQTKF